MDAAALAAARRLSSEDGARPRYYDDAGEDSALLYQRDELMNAILEDEDALITEHRKQIESTMTIVRAEMSLLTEARRLSFLALASIASAAPSELKL